MTKIYFFHGAFSSPNSIKIQRLKTIAESRGLQTIIPDHSQVRDPEKRIADMMSQEYSSDEKAILAGSSMGGYVATVLSEHIQPAGLFLLAPAFFIPNYLNQNPVPNTEYLMAGAMKSSPLNIVFALPKSIMRTYTSSMANIIYAKT